MDFVTICHWNDMPQMKIQAKSISNFLQNFPINKIKVVINDYNFDQCLTYFTNNILDNYGNFKNRVEIFNGQKILDYIDDGYMDQQRLKILISKQIETDDYCILDAKNFLIKNWSIEDIKQNDKFIGQFINETSYVAFKDSFAYYGLDQIEHKKIYSLTPFFAPTKIVQQIAEDKILFEQWKYIWFQEFELIQACMIKNGIKLENYYFYDGYFRSGIWEEYIQYYMNPDTFIDQLTGLINCNTKSHLCSGVHRRALTKLPACILDQLKIFWNDLNLATFEQSQIIFDEIKALN